MNLERFSLLHGALILVLVFSCSRPLLWADPSDSGTGGVGQYGTDITQDDNSDDEQKQYHGAKQVTEQEGRQKDLTKWVQDVELLNQKKQNPEKEAPAPQKETLHTPGYLDSMPALPGQPSFLENQKQMESDVDDEVAFQKQALDGIQQEIMAARKVAKAGNSISIRADGAVFMSYHGLMMGVANQHYQDGLGQNTTVSMSNITYDFSTRLMLGFTKVSVDPRGNVSIQQRLNTTYTPDSSGLPDHIQRVTGYTEIDTAPGGQVTVVTRSNGQYDPSSPAYNNINYGGNLITSYDQTSYVQGDPDAVTTTYFRNGTYDAYGNQLTYTQTVVYPEGETLVTQRLSSTYQANPNYVDQFKAHVIEYNYTMPQFYLTGYDQYTADYVMVNGSPVELNTPAQIQHYTNITYNNQGLMTGQFMVATLPDDLTEIEVKGYSVSSFDEWGNPLTWQTIDTNMNDVLTISNEVATTYDQLNHQTFTDLQSECEDGTIGETTTEMTYDSLGLLIDELTQTTSSQDNGDAEQIALEDELAAEAGVLFPHGGGLNPTLPTFTGNF